MRGARKLHLAYILGHDPAHHVVGAWAMPQSLVGYDYARPQLWEHIGRTLERGRFDMVFFADSYNLHDVYQGRPDAAIRYAVQYPKHDPMPLVPIITRATSHIGVAVTSSTTYTHPYYLARLLATLDHLSEGRVGWNVVTSYGANEAANFGLESALTHDERYARAHEYMEVCYKLWDSWDDDAIVMDRTTGMFADPSKVRRIDHQGRYFKSRGPLTVRRSPQGRPVIIQAGASGAGLAFAATHAEVHFASRGSLAGMKEHAAKLADAARAVGRQPDAIRILWATSAIVAETEAEAIAREAAIRAAVPLEGGLALMSGHFGYDFSRLPLDEPIRNLGLEGTEGVQGNMTMLQRDYGDISLKEAAIIYGNGIGGLRIVGDARQVADKLEEAIEVAGGAGFMFRPDALPSSIDGLVNLLVPELQARGLLRKEYGGRTLRDHIAED
ncbi:MAG: NtaA/DmoA family FMN-dependent monooxygenase [Reyranella sp.]|nr:NtaA/DmoA family FMN-dependent monooxygenase [Reyranella sp.]